MNLHKMHNANRHKPRTSALQHKTYIYEHANRISLHMHAYRFQTPVSVKITTSVSVT